jgi:hypothetical protein
MALRSPDALQSADIMQFREDYQPRIAQRGQPRPKKGILHKSKRSKRRGNGIQENLVGNEFDQLKFVLRPRRYFCPRIPVTPWKSLWRKHLRNGGPSMPAHLMSSYQPAENAERA